MTCLPAFKYLLLKISAPHRLVFFARPFPAREDVPFNKHVSALANGSMLNADPFSQFLYARVSEIPGVPMETRSNLLVRYFHVAFIYMFKQNATSFFVK